MLLYQSFLKGVIIPIPKKFTLDPNKFEHYRLFILGLTYSNRNETIILDIDV